VVPQPASPVTWDSYFTAKQDAIIIRSLQSVFKQTEFFEQTFLYNVHNQEQQLVTNNGKATGWRITPVKRQDVTVQVNSLQLYFTEAETFNVYLFKQGSNVPVKTKEVTTVANVKTTVALTDWYISYKDASEYYIVIFQDDLGTAQAIREETYGPCHKMFSADPFSSNTSGFVFDRDEQTYGDEPFGINANISSFRDFTANILNQPQLFDELQGLGMAIQTLEEILYSTRSNSTERILKEQIQTIGLQLDLNGSAAISNGPKMIGLRQRAEMEAKRIADSFYYKPKAQVINVAH
jgi:hypothetical protein